MSRISQPQSSLGEALGVRHFRYWLMALRHAFGLRLIGCGEAGKATSDDNGSPRDANITLERRDVTLDGLIQVMHPESRIKRHFVWRQRPQRQTGSTKEDLDSSAAWCTRLKEK